uniref:Putative TBC1 domain family member 13 n=1 Tax=Pinctada fucata TaxID=50426 RepID=A0A194ANV6_PINFU
MLLCIAVAVLFSLCSSQHDHLNAHEIALHVDDAFVKLDVNPKDGQLEMDELSKIFDLRDEDHDGSLSKAEFEKHASNTPIRDRLFDFFDANHDHSLGKTEFVDDNIAMMDKDSDHIVTRKEFDHFYTQIVNHMVHDIQHVDHGNHGHHGH